VVQAYIDESGTHTNTDTPVVCVACYFAPYSRWSAFNREWLPILKQKKILCFHAKNPKHDKVRPFLAKIIDDCRLKGVIVAVSRSEYQQYASPQMRSALGSAYSACLSQCVFKTRSLVRTYHPDKKVSFFIEAGQPKTEHIEASLKLMINDKLPRDEFAQVAAVAWVKKEDFTPLQTADFLSHIYSTQDMTWFNFLTRRRLIWLARIESEVLEDTSDGVKVILSRRRWLRKIAKQS
jgi:hypothetical protein